MVAQFVVAVWCCGPVVLSSLVVHASLNNVALYSSFLSLVFFIMVISMSRLCVFVFVSFVSLHLVYSTLLLSVWFCPSEHRSNLIRSPPVRVRPLVLDRLMIFDFCVRVCRRQGSRNFAIFRWVSFLLVYH